MRRLGDRFGRGLQPHTSGIEGRRLGRGGLLALVGLVGITLSLPLFGRWLRSEPFTRASTAPPNPDVASAPPALPAGPHNGEPSPSALESMRDLVDVVRAEGASEAEVFALREREFGAEVAERLARVDEQRAVWRARLDAYRIEREALLATSLASNPVERDRALTALREKHFDQRERLRVRASDEAELSVRAHGDAPVTGGGEPRR